MEDTPATIEEINQSLYGKQAGGGSKAHPKSAPEKRTTADGIVFDSVLEMKRYNELMILLQCGEITKLHLQPEFDIRWSDGTHLCYVTPDFSYINVATNAVVIEDVKGFKKSKKTGKMLPRVDREFGLKRKLLRCAFGLEIVIV